MQIVHADELKWKRTLQHRGGTFHGRLLLNGESGSIDNFQMNLGKNDNDFVSPRHKHNFEQFRFQLEGELDFARDGRMTAGWVGYFPEGAPYGPQTTETKSMTIVVQFGGASGSGYIGRDEVRRGQAELEQQGEFKDGVFRRHKGQPGKMNLDAYQAIWEHVNGRPMTYPKPRYPGPILMDPENFSWTPVEGVAGASEKRLGVFTECRSGVGFIRLDEGASYTITGPILLFTYKGSGQAGQQQQYRPMTAIRLTPGDTLHLRASEPSEMIFFELPQLAHLHRTSPNQVAAAE